MNRCPSTGPTPDQDRKHLAGTLHLSCRSPVLPRTTLAQESDSRASSRPPSTSEESRVGDREPEGPSREFLDPWTPESRVVTDGPPSRRSDHTFPRFSLRKRSGEGGRPGKSLQNRVFLQRVSESSSTHLVWGRTKSPTVREILV